LGLLCALLAALMLFQRTPNPLARGAGAALLPLERVLTLRLHFDAGLFADLARAMPTRCWRWTHSTTRCRHCGCARRRPSQRPLAERVDGACRLLFWQGSCVLLQFGTLAARAVLAGWVGLAA
jgi:hypothetical protein